MKNVFFAVVVMGLGLVGMNSYAFGIGNVTGTRTESLVKDGAKLAVVSETNKKLATQSASCKCDAKTGKVTNCDYAAIKKTVDNVKTGLQAALDRNANFNVKTGAQECSSQVQSSITGWWYWKTQVDSGMGSGIKMWLN